jgi:hypothetical protein
MGAREVVLAGAAEHDAVAGLGGGALEPEVADAAVALGLRDVGEPGLQVDVVQRALRHARLPAASATPAATDAHGEMQSSTEESCGECEDRSSASEKHCLPSSSSEPSSARRRSTSCTAPAIADCSPSFTIATKETNLRNQLFRKRKGVTELALARNPDTSKLGRKQTRIKRRKRAPRTKAQETQLNAAGHEKQRGEKNPKLLDSKLLVKGAEVYGIGWLEGWEF